MMRRYDSARRKFSSPRQLEDRQKTQPASNEAPCLPVPAIIAQQLVQVEEAAARFARAEYNRRAKRRLSDSGGLQLKELTPFLRPIHQLSDSFTSDRSLLKPNYFNQPTICTAYALYYFPINYAKSYQECLEIAGRLPHLLRKPALNILDLGCGLGASSFGVIDGLKRLGFHGSLYNLAIDATPAALRSMLQLKKLLDPDNLVTLDTVHREIGRFTENPETTTRFEIIILMNVMNELRGPRSMLSSLASLITAAEERLLADGGVIILLEPAMPRISRLICRLHDILLGQLHACELIFPCVGSYPCPLKRSREWCHTSRWWPQPPLAKKFDRFLGHNNSRLKYCHLVIHKSSSGQPRLTGERCTVLSDLIPDQHGRFLLLCRPPGLSRIPSRPGQQAPPRGSHVLLPQLQWRKNGSVFVPVQSDRISWQICM